MNQIGEVIAARGQVQAISDAEPRTLEIGSPVFQGDEIVTGPTANVEIRFTDDSVLAQGPSAQMSLDDYVYDPDQPSASNMLYQAATGTFRVVTGKIAELNPDGVEVKTPLATIGIRGTGMDIESRDEGLKVGIFYYHQFDVVITSPEGTRFITDGDILIEIFPDGTFGEPRPYTAEEKMTFETLAPITSLGDIMDEDAGEGEEGEEGEEGQEGEEEEGEEGEEGEETPDETVELQQQQEELFPTITGLLGMPVTVLVGPGVDFDFGDFGPDLTARDFEILDEEDEALADEAAGEADSDTLFGGSGNDILLGSDRDETLLGQGGNDYLYGGGGNDWLVGGPGRDSLYGGDGDDTLVFYTNDATSGEVIDGGAGTNQIYVISNDADFSGASLDGGTFASILLGSGQTAEFAGSQISGQTWTLYGMGSNAITIGDCCGETVDLRGLSFPSLGGQYMNQLILDATGATFKFTAEQLLGIPGGLKIGVPPGGDIGSLIFQVDPGTYTGSLFDLFDFSGASGHPSITELAGDTLLGTEGADTLVGTSGADSIIAKGGNDSLFGDTGGDTIYGCDGDDTIEGGGGNDYLYGGDGNDQFYFDTDQNGGYIYGGAGSDSLVIEGDVDLSQVWYINGIEAIVFFGAGSELTVGGSIGSWTLYGNGLSNLIFKALGTSTYTYLSNLEPPVGWNGRILFDDGGYGYSNRVYGSDYADSMDGGAGNDTLEGNAGNDTLLGGDGNDCLVGGDGNDCLSGGAGDDTLYPGSGVNRADGGTGTDILTLYNSSVGLNRTLAPGSGSITHDGMTVTYSGIEGYGLTNGNDTITGTSGNDIFYGNSGNDIISALGGNNFVDGGYGNDTLSGIDGRDTLIGGYGNDCLVGNCERDSLIGDSGNDTLLGGNENDTLIGGYGNDSLLGEDGNDFLDGGDGNDCLFGSSGDDILNGGGNNDLLLGGDNDDTLDGGYGNDVLNGEAGNDSLFGGWGAYADSLAGGDGDDTLDGGDGDDTLTGGFHNDILLGGYGNDTLSGGSGNDILDGGVGDDTVMGGQGDDCLVGGSGFDFADYSDITNALNITVDQSSWFYVSGASTDSLSGFEGVIGTDLSGSGDTLTADANSATYLVALDGDDILVGQDGDDTLDGGDGDDTINGGLGDDWIIPGADVDNDGNDTVYVDGQGGAANILSLEYSSVAFNNVFNTGNDTLSLDGVYTDYSNIHGLAGTNGGDDITGTGSDDIFYGLDGNDTIVGAGGIDSLYGDDGNDCLEGGVGDDFLDGGAGNDKLYGEDDNDSLIGNDGNDSIYGGAGDDTLEGGAGADVLSGGAGANVLSGGDTSYTDKFVFDVLSISDAADEITDFDFYYEDQIWIDADAALFTTFAPTAPHYFTGTKLNVLLPNYSYMMTTTTYTSTTMRSSATVSYTAGFLPGWNLAGQNSVQITDNYTTYNLHDPPQQTITIGGVSWFLTRSSANVSSQYSSRYYAWYTRQFTHWVGTFTRTSTSVYTISTFVQSVIGTGVNGTFSNANAAARVPHLWRVDELTAAMGDGGVAENGVAFVWDSANRELEAWFVDAGDVNVGDVTVYVIASLTGSGDPGLDTDIYIY